MINTNLKASRGLYPVCQIKFVQNIPFSPVLLFNKAYCFKIQFCRKIYFFNLFKNFVCASRISWMH